MSVAKPSDEDVWAIAVRVCTANQLKALRLKAKGFSERENREHHRDHAPCRIARALLPAVQTSPVTSSNLDLPALWTRQSSEQPQ